MVLKRDGGHTRARSKLASESHTVNPFSFQLLSRGRSWFASAVASVSTFQGLLGQGLSGQGPLGRALLAIAFVASACDGSSDSPGDLVSIRRRLEPSLSSGASSGGSSGGSSERSNERGTSPGSADPLTALYADAGLEVRVDPPAPAGDLKAEIARFTTLDACVNERARVDPIVGDALEAIGYDTFLRDACRVIDATKANDPARCAAIEASSLEARCRTTVAEVSGAPETCPWESTLRRAQGRDARCLAVASRDPRLCPGVRDALERATCDATLGLRRQATTSPCATLRTAGEQSRCARDAERWKSVLDLGAAGSKGAAAADAQPFVVAGNLHVEAAPGPEGPSAAGPSSAPIDVDLAPDVARGLIIVVHRDGARITLGPLAEGPPDFVAPSPHMRASLALELFVSGVIGASGLMPSKAQAHARSDAGAASSARIERVELLLPGRLAISTPGAQSTLVATVTIGGAAPARGSSIELEIHGDLGASGARWHVRASATTFVRDIVTSNDLYGGSLSPRSGPFLGDDAGMR